MNAIAQSYTSREQRVLGLFKRHVAAFNSGNLDAVLDDFGEHSVVVTPEGVFEGLARIRAVYPGCSQSSASSTAAIRRG